MGGAVVARSAAVWRWLGGQWSGFWSAWRAGQGPARRAGWVAAGLAAVTAAIVVVLAETVDAEWVPALSPAVIAVPGLYLMFKAVPGPTRSAPGRLVAEWSAHELGVHAVVGGGDPPPYVLRAHDVVLRGLLDPGVAASRLVVVRGESSTRKTRALLEAMRAVLPG